MNTKDELQEKIKLLQKEISECDNDAQAILLQKNLIDLLSKAFKNKDYLTELMSKKKE